MDKRILHDIVKEAIRGDVAAFEKLYHIHAKSILFHTRNLIGNESDAEDVAQEVVMQMYKSIGQLKTPYAFSAWLHRITINACNNYNQKHNSRSGREDVLDTVEEPYEEKEDHLPEVKAENEDIRTRFLRSIDALPKMQQTALVMHYYDELGYKEIAKALGVTTSTISTNIRKAKANLKRILEKEEAQKSGASHRYSGAAFGSLLAETLRSKVDDSVPAAEVEKFCKVCDSQVEAYLGPRSMMAGAGVHPNLVVQLVTGVAVVGVVVCVIAFYHPDPAQTEAPANDTAPAAVHSTVSVETLPAAPDALYKPTASIHLRSASGKADGVNPIEASITINDESGEAILWMIADAAGDEVASGEGDLVTAPFSALSADEYYIKWTIQNEAGASAIRSARFFVK
jgi:RNA polymerase sigma-70 factor (ECF subfamily)